jgi:hypothetical protein
MEESGQKKKKTEKVYFYLGHNKLKKANLDQVFSSRSGTIAHKNKKRITAVTHPTTPFIFILSPKENNKIYLSMLVRVDIRCGARQGG